ncbi:MAG: right-handed parallel beta-helix repeat-containing protein, partial [Verrucomicrobiales bacterium]
VNHHNLISNNHIHHVGRIYPHSPGIFLWQSGENRAANNLVHHTPYSGIIISGAVTSFFSKRGNSREVVRTMRRHELGSISGKATLEQVRPFLHTHDNLIESNEIYHAMQQLNDGNGIYIRGAGAGNIIRRNYIHDLLAPTVMQSSIRTDGGQRDTLITENLIFRCVSQGMQIKLNNHAINNVIADIRPGIHKGEQRRPTYFKLYEGPMTGGAYQRNILYHPGAETTFYQEIKNFRTPVGAYARDADTDFNIYYSAKDPSLGKAVLVEKQREGVDKHSVAEDPLFENPAKGDFRFKPGSPALKMGIVPIDLSKIGLSDPSQIPSQ